jgi:hypothetical protein
MDIGNIFTFKQNTYIIIKIIYKMMGFFILEILNLINFTSLFIKKSNQKVFKGLWKSYNHMTKKTN